jgi:hypothetical protein
MLPGHPEESRYIMNNFPVREHFSTIFVDIQVSLKREPAGLPVPSSG